MKKINPSAYKDYFSDKKTMLTIFSMTLAFILTIVLSFGANFFFRDLDESFFSDLAISFALCVYCLYFGIPEGKSLYQKKEGGRYKKALMLFEGERAKSVKRDFEFSQWLEKYYQKNKRDYLLSILSLHGNINPYVLDLDYLELDELKHPFKKVWDETEFKGRKPTYFRSLTDEQIKVIKEIYQGGIKVERIPDDFFKTLNGKILLSEYIEQTRAKKKNTLTYFLLICGRLVLIVLFALAFSLFGMDFLEKPSASEVFSRIFTTISRLWTMLSSFVYGFSLGKYMVMKDSNVLEFKGRVNREFNEDTTFKYVDIEELAEKEYQEYEKKIESDNKNVEIVNEEDVKRLGITGIEMKKTTR